MDSRDRGSRCVAGFAANGEQDRAFMVGVSDRRVRRESSAPASRCGRCPPWRRFSKLPVHKTLEQFDSDAQPTLHRRLVEGLATQRFIEENAHGGFTGAWRWLGWLHRPRRTSSAPTCGLRECPPALPAVVPGAPERYYESRAGTPGGIRPAADRVGTLTAAGRCPRRPGWVQDPDRRDLFFEGEALPTYGVSTATVNTTVLLYVPVCNASVAAIGCSALIVTGSALTGAR